MANYRLIGQKLPYHSFSRGEDRTGGYGSQDLCEILTISAFLVDLEQENGEFKQALCFELVGNRFLRNMVRVIVVSHFYFKFLHLFAETPLN